MLLSNALDAAGRRGVDFVTDVLAVLVLGASAAQMGLLNAIGTLAFLVLGIPIGVLVDRSPTVRLLAGSGLVRAMLLATVITALALDSLTMVHLYLVAGLVGTTTVVTETTQTAIAPRVAGQDAVAALEMLDPPRDEFPPRPDETCPYYEAELSFFERVDVHVVCFASDQVSRIGTVPAP